MTKFRTLDDLGDLAGERVLVREDLNVPMADGRVTDDTRLRAAAPTLGELADKGAKVLILAHFGRPKGERKPDMSLALVTQALSDPIATLAVQSGHGSFDDHASGVVRREMYHESTRPNLKEPYRNRQEGAMVTRIASRWLIKTYR